MINHIVMWKLKENANGKSKAENIDLLIEGYEALKKAIPQVKNAKICKSAIPGDTHDLILISAFENQESLEEYLKHPKHLEYSEFCKSVRESRASIDYLD